MGREATVIELKQGFSRDLVCVCGRRKLFFDGD